MSLPTVIYLMGTSGSGKSTIAEALSKRIGYTFIDGDHLHTQANRDKMASGVALNDEDRLPWLNAIHEQAKTHPKVVIACSALKTSYRVVLRESLDAFFVFLRVDRAILKDRMTKRVGHFIAPSLLDSQLTTLEEPKNEPDILVIENNGEYGVDEIVTLIHERIKR